MSQVFLRTSGSGIGDSVSHGTPDCVLYIDGSGNLACNSEFKYIAAATQIFLSNDWDTILGIPTSGGLALQNTIAGSSSNLTRGVDFIFNNAVGSVIDFGYVFGGSPGVGNGVEGGLFGVALVQYGSMANAFTINAATGAIRLGGINYDLSWDGTSFIIGKGDSGGLRNLYINAGSGDDVTIGMLHIEGTYGWKWNSEAPTDQVLKLSSIADGSVTEVLTVEPGGDFKITSSLGVGGPASGSLLEIFPGAAAKIGAVIRGNTAANQDVFRCVNSASSAYFLVVKSDGKIAIGSTTANAKVDVVGGAIRSTRSDAFANVQYVEMDMGNAARGTFRSASATGNQKDMVFDQVIDSGTVNAARGIYWRQGILNSEVIRMAIMGSGSIGIGNFATPQTWGTFTSTELCEQIYVAGGGGPHLVLNGNYPDINYYEQDGVADGKWFVGRLNTGYFNYSSVKDDNTYNKQYLLSMQTTTGYIGINSQAGVGQLSIERNNTDYTNTSGAGTHILLTNANASGVTCLMALVNSAAAGKIRFDSSKNLTYVAFANANNLGHFFYVNGDFGVGSCWMFIGNKGVVIGSAAATTASQAWLTLTLGGSGANQAPLKFQDSSGVVLATPEAGAVEFSSNRLYITNSTPARKTVAYTDDEMPGSVPVGGVLAWLKSYTNTPALSSWYVECNGQTLSDAASVFNGQTIPNLNGSSATKRFLRGSTTSGTTGGTESHSHTGTTSTESSLANADTNADGSQSSFASGCHTHTFTTSTDGTLPSYYEVVWIIRVK